MTTTTNPLFPCWLTAIHKPSQQVVTIVASVGLTACEVIPGAFRRGIDYMESGEIVPVNELIVLHEIGDRKYG